MPSRIQHILQVADLWDYLAITDRRRILGAGANAALPKPKNDGDLITLSHARAAIQVLEMGGAQKIGDTKWPKTIHDRYFPKSHILQDTLKALLEQQLEESEAAEYLQYFGDGEGTITTQFGSAAVAAMLLGLLQVYAHEEDVMSLGMSSEDQLNEVLDSMGILARVDPEGATLDAATKNKIAAEVFHLQARAPHLVYHYLELVEWVVQGGFSFAGKKAFKSGTLVHVMQIFSFLDAGLARQALENIVHGKLGTTYVRRFFSTLTKIAGLPEAQQRPWRMRLQGALQRSLGTEWRNGDKESLRDDAEVDLEDFVDNFVEAVGDDDTATGEEELVTHDVADTSDNSPQPPLKVRGGERGSYDVRYSTAPAEHVDDVLDPLGLRSKRIVIEPAYAKAWAQQYVELAWAYRQLQLGRDCELGTPIPLGPLTCNFLPGTIPEFRSIVITDASSDSGQVVWEIHPNGILAIHGAAGLSDWSLTKIDAALTNYLRYFSGEADKSFVSPLPGWEGVGGRVAGDQKNTAAEFSGIARYTQRQILLVLEDEPGLDLELVKAYLETGSHVEANRRVPQTSKRAAYGKILVAQKRLHKIILGLSEAERMAVQRAGEKAVKLSPTRHDRFIPDNIDIRRSQNATLTLEVRKRLALGVMTNSFVPLTEKEKAALSPNETKVTLPYLAGQDLDAIASENGFTRDKVSQHLQEARLGILAMRRPQTPQQWIKFYREFLILEYTGILGFDAKIFAALFSQLPERERDLITWQFEGRSVVAVGELYQKKYSSVCWDLFDNLKDRMKDLALATCLPLGEIAKLEARVHYTGTLRSSAELGFLPEQHLAVVRLLESGTTDRAALASALGMAYNSVTGRVRRLERALTNGLDPEERARDRRKVKIWAATGTFLIDDMLWKKLIKTLPEEWQRALTLHVAHDVHGDAVAAFGKSRGGYEYALRQGTRTLRLLIANGLPYADTIPSPGEFAPPVLAPDRCSREHLPLDVRRRMTLFALTRSFVIPTALELTLMSDVIKNTTAQLLHHSHTATTAAALDVAARTLHARLGDVRSHFRTLRPVRSFAEYLKFYQEFIRLEFTGIIGLDDALFQELLQEVSKRDRDLMIDIYTNIFTHAADLTVAGSQIVSPIKIKLQERAVRHYLPLREVLYAEDRVSRLLTLLSHDELQELGLFTERQLKVIGAVEDGYIEQADIARVIGETARIVDWDINQIKNVVRLHYGEEHIKATQRQARLWRLVGSFHISSEAHAMALSRELVRDYSAVIRTYLAHGITKEGADALGIKFKTYRWQVKQAQLGLQLLMANRYRHLTDYVPEHLEGPKYQIRTRIITLPLAPSPQGRENKIDVATPVVNGGANLAQVVSAMTGTELVTNGAMALHPEPVLLPEEEVATEADAPVDEGEQADGNGEEVIGGGMPMESLSPGLVPAVAHASGTAAATAVHTVFLKR